LVLTAIDKEAFPILRYRTGDITSITREPCACGRTFARIARVMRRTDDMIMIHGMKIFPHDIREVIESIDAGPRFQIVLDREEGEDTMEVQVELSAPPASGVLAELDTQRKSVEERLRKNLRLPVSVRFVEPSSIAPVGETTGLVIDNREI
ncbi:MAG: phenylacetate--CoA ligase family protein, partial [Armatimonadota bacterium]